MKKNLFLLFTAILSVAILSGCASAKKDKSMESIASTVDKASGASTDGFNDTKTAAQSPEKKPAEQPKTNANAYAIADKSIKGITTTSTSTTNMTNAILAQRKIIRNANISVEVDDFDKSYGQIKSIIGAFGFVQESNIKKDKVYVNSQEKLITRGVIILRVDKDRFESVLSDVKGLGLLMDESIKSDDVTDQFIDTESMLRLLKYEQSRLEEYLFKITDPDIIFKTEARLTEIRQQIEKLTGNLKKWSDLVDLSTITINMSEKRPDATGMNGKEVTYWNKLSTSFKESIKGVVGFAGGFLIFIVGAIPVIFVLTLIGVLAFWVYRRFIKKFIDEKNRKING